MLFEYLFLYRTVSFSDDYFQFAQQLFSEKFHVEVKRSEPIFEPTTRLNIYLYLIQRDPQQYMLLDLTFKLKKLKIAKPLLRNGKIKKTTFE